MARRRWTLTPRRCAVCRRWLSRSRWRLGLSVCSGACNRKRPGGLVSLEQLAAALVQRDDRS